MVKFGHSEHFRTILVQKYWKKFRLDIIGHSKFISIVYILVSIAAAETAVTIAIAKMGIEPICL